MITKTASEIIHGAQVKAGVYNIDFLDSLTITNELNNAYRELYWQVANSDSDYFVKSVIFHESVFELPFDCFFVKTIAFVNNDGSWSNIPKQNPNQYEYGCYYIEDNIVHINGDVNRPILVRYVPTPQTITCPREMEAIELDTADIKTFGLMTENGFYYKNSDNEKCYYSFESASSEVIDTFKKQPTVYLHHKITIDYDEQTVTATSTQTGEEEDWSDIFAFDDLTFTNIVFDSPYAMVTYNDGSIKVFHQLNGTRWNIKASTGHETVGFIHGLKTNDKTLFGCIYEDEDGYLWRASFVPDTILNYPTNALFNYLEVILARLFCSMNGIENAYIQQELFNQVRHQFQLELRQDHNAVVRVTNRMRRTMNGLR